MGAQLGDRMLPGSSGWGTWAGGGQSLDTPRGSTSFHFTRLQPTPPAGMPCIPLSFWGSDSGCPSSEARTIPTGDPLRHQPFGLWRWGGGSHVPAVGVDFGIQLQKKSEQS